MNELSQVERNILDHYTDVQVGDVLRKAREAAGVDLQTISANLNIMAMHLQAIEQGDASRLPESVYAVGFVKAYADYLNLDKDKIVYLFKRQVLGQVPQRNTARTYKPVGPSIFPRAAIVAACAAVLVIGLVLYLVFGRGGEPAVDPVSEDLRQSTLAETKTALPLKPNKLVTGKQYGAEPAQSKLMLLAIDSVWIEVRDKPEGGKVLFNRVMKKGEAYHAPLTPQLWMNSGKVQNIELWSKGEKLSALKNRKDIIRSFQLPNVGKVTQQANEASNSELSE